ncbi:MAG: N-(5'-phosphoribosyl)anthranilate isomerase [Bacteroidetes bacterium]|nr:N-(5'-phosphoribosyl)anthranilate isomerase [Bacteroidota bacterium]
MTLKTMVKVGQITNLSNARYCAGMGVNMLGFVVDDGSEFFISPEQFREISGWVAGVEFVGEISGSQIPELTGYSFSYLQVSDRALPEIVHASGYACIFYINTANYVPEHIALMMEEQQKYVSYFLLEGLNPDILDDAELERITTWAASYPVWLGSGITPHNLEKLLASGIKGIALYGGTESKPGFKDYDELADILEALDIV